MSERAAKSKVTKLFDRKQPWQGQSGMMDSWGIILENGDQGAFNKRQGNVPEFKVGDEIEYTIKPNNFKEGEPDIIKIINWPGKKAYSPKGGGGGGYRSNPTLDILKTAMVQAGQILQKQTKEGGDLPTADHVKEQLANWYLPAKAFYDADAANKSTEKQDGAKQQDAPPAAQEPDWLKSSGDEEDDLPF